MTLFDPPLVDELDRRRIAHELDRNLFVEAGAGTGKTTVLVARVVNLIASGHLPEVTGLVAITFTEAAAAELRDRIRRALDHAAVDPDRPAAERARCAEARRRIDEAVISTLHGFAQRILAEHPLEAGLPPRFEVDDGVLAGVRFVERWAVFLDELYADPDVAHDLLVANALGLTANHLLDVARTFHDRWDRVVDADLTPRCARPPIDANPILDALDAAFAVAGDRIGGDDNLAIALATQWLDFREHTRAAALEADPLEVLRAVHPTPKVGGAGRAPYWDGDKPTIVAHLERARDAALDLVRRHREATVEHLLPRLQAFTREGVEERRRAGVLEFHDLLVHARDLLRRDAEVRATLAERFRVLLIDEFQDTDPIQLDLAFLLAAADPAAPPARDWRDIPLAEGKVLIVGDPKQSIYAFRGADISVWDEAKAALADGVVRLAQNFRTVPPIVEWVNEVFSSVIGGGRPRSQPPYSPLAPARLPIEAGPAVVLLGGAVDGRIDEVRARESSEIASLLQLAKQGGWQVSDAGAAGGTRAVRFDDVAILLPTRTALGHLERALDAAGVPYRIESRSLIWATDAVRELLAVLAAVDDPADDVAVVAALRSPAFACSDIDLLSWRTAGGRWRYTAALPEGIEEDHPVASAFAALRGYHERRNGQPVDLLVEQVIRERHLVELAFAQRRPRDHWRRLRFVLDQARAFVEAGGRSLGELLAWAELQRVEGAAVVETPAPEADDDAVRILTIHGSKGLEFPLVVLAGLGTALRNAGPLVAWAPERPEVALGRRTDRFTTTGFEGAAADAERVAADEGSRLLYVAATRARDHLVVGLTHAAGNRSHAAALWEVCRDDTAGPLAALARRVELGDQLALDVGEGYASPRPIDLEQRRRWLAEHEALLDGIRRPRAVTPTSLTHGDDPELPAPEPPVADDEPSPAPGPGRRGGTAVGRAVHGVLQVLDLRARDAAAAVPALAAHVAAAEGVADAAEDVAAMVVAALRSPVMRAAATAKRTWRELPMAVPLGDGRVLEGYVDLLVELADGELVVVDFKTDQRPDPDRYRAQLAAYVLGIERVAGRRPSRAVLLFTSDTGATELDVTDLPAAVEEVAARLGVG